MATESTKRRLFTILSIDVAGYSRMMGENASALLNALNAILRSVVKPRVGETGGRIVKLLGDGAIVEFPSAYNAFTCAAAIFTSGSVAREFGLSETSQPRSRRFRSTCPRKRSPWRGRRGPTPIKYAFASRMTASPRPGRPSGRDLPS